MLMSVYLVLIVIVFRRAGASDAETLNPLSFGMIALAMGGLQQEFLLISKRQRLQKELPTLASYQSPSTSMP
jgi:hypothetical protein